MPIVPTGSYYSPALVSMGAQGAFEGALGGLDKVYAQDLARERLRGLREERQFRTAKRAAALQGGLIQDPLDELMAGGGGGVPRRSGGGGRYSTARERSAGQAGPISRVDAEEAARYQHELASVDRALREYQSAQSDYLGAGGPPPRARVGTEGPDYEAQPGPTPADMALALQRDASLEDEGTRRLRAALFEDQGGGGQVEITPTVNEYREGLAGMSDERFGSLGGYDPGQLAIDNMGGYGEPMDIGPRYRVEEYAGRTRENFARDTIRRAQAEQAAARNRQYPSQESDPEGWSWEGDPITKFARSLGDESVDPRSAPPALQAIEESIRTTKSPRDRKVLERAYGQLQRGVALDAKARRSGNYEAQMEAGTQIEQAMGLLDPNLVSAMGLARPESEFDENLPESVLEYRRRMKLYTELPVSLEMTPGYEGIWNPAVDIGLAATTILDPSTLSAIGSLADDGNPMAKRMLGRLGAEPVSAQEAIKKGLVGDVVEYRSKLAAHLNEEQQLLKGAGVDDDERAKAFLLGLIKIHGPDSFSVDNPDDLAVARGAVNMPPAAQKVWLEQLFHTKAQGGKEELERLKAETAGVTRRNVHITAGGGRNEDVKLLGIEVDSLEKLRGLRSKKKFQRSAVEYTPEKFPHLDDEIATLEGEIDTTETRIKEIRSRIYPGGAPPKRKPKEDLVTPTAAPAATPAKKHDTSKVEALVRKRMKDLSGPALGEEMDKLLTELKADGSFSKQFLKAVRAVYHDINYEQMELRKRMKGVQPGHLSPPRRPGDQEKEKKSPTGNPWLDHHPALQ